MQLKMKSAFLKNLLNEEEEIGFENG